ncbi:MAG: ExbD/TolR family protein [Pseudomonadota bacterium]|jgi:biopolymer transport protein ExbD
MNFRTRRRPDDVELNFVPLIDVLIVLLIFLMVTTSFNRLSELRVDLPQAASDAALPADNSLELIIAADGRGQLGPQSIAAGDIAGLLAALRRAMVGIDDPVLVLSVDRLTPHERVIAAMQAAREAGIENITFAVETADSTP